MCTTTKIKTSARKASTRSSGGVSRSASNAALEDDSEASAPHRQRRVRRGFHTAVRWRGWHPFDRSQSWFEFERYASETVRILGLDPDQDRLLASALDSARRELWSELRGVPARRRGVDSPAAMLARRRLLVVLATRLRGLRIEPALDSAPRGLLEQTCEEVAAELTFGEPNDPSPARGFDPLEFRFELCRSEPSESAALGWIRLAFVVGFLPSQRRGLARCGLDEAAAAQRVAQERDARRVAAQRDARRTSSQREEPHDEEAWRRMRDERSSG